MAHPPTGSALVLEASEFAQKMPAVMRRIDRMKHWKLAGAALIISITNVAGSQCAFAAE
jgi:hypothetical protein